MITKLVAVVVLLSISSLFNLSLAQGMELALCVNGVSSITVHSRLLYLSEILKDPENKTVFLHQSALFTCETDGSISSWRINGTLPGDLPPAVHSDLELSSIGTDNGTTLLILTIPARAEYNNTRVQCLTGTFGGSSVESETAILKVQGIIHVSIYSMNKCLQ